MGGTTKDQLVPSPYHVQGQLPLGQATQSLIQSDLEDLQGWDIHNLDDTESKKGARALLKKRELSSPAKQNQEC